jgi:SH3 domain protein
MRPFGIAWIRNRSGVLASWVLLGLALGASSAGAAEQGWVRGDLRLNLRSGGGNEYRILGTLATGDQVKVLDKGTDWSRVETADGKVGWIPAGYVELTPPAVARLATVEAEASTLRSELEKFRGEATALRESNAALASNDDGQRKEIDTLRLENLEMRAVSRYQEWLTGAAILGGGMVAGALLQRRSANRRPSSRIRL